MSKLLKYISNLEFAKSPIRKISAGIKQPRKPYVGLRRILHDSLAVGQSAEVSHPCIKAGKIYKGAKRKHGRCELSYVAMVSTIDRNIPYMIRIKHPDGKFNGIATVGQVQKVWKEEIPYDLHGKHMHGKITTTNLAIAIEKRKAKLSKQNRAPRFVVEEGSQTKPIYEDVVVTDSYDYSTDSLRNKVTFPRE